MSNRKLLIARHSFAQSVGSVKDRERNLTQSGKQIARDCYKELVELNLNIDLALVSDAVRTTQTFEIFKEVVQYKKQMYFIKRLYYGNVDDYIQQISSISSEHKQVLIIGHNPMVSYLSMKLSYKFQKVFAPSSIAVFGANIANWVEVENGEWQLEKFISANI